ncbi:hypothetical protein CHS0354_042430 [Potamilus streckersoni]|uniref:SOCS box domain-containing protein n=1 Tax=Potamilus streckersoni TaxID=2493646 RepID=A0AAE0STQ6_9BIVA|nr:hypothetical protein CHS0354_042430 [Potamilus streckersoni]
MEMMNTQGFGQLCYLCTLINMGKLSEALDFLKKCPKIQDPDNLAVYKTIKYYCQYLLGVSQSFGIALATTCTSEEVTNGQVRELVIEILKILFAAGVTPNTVTRLETPLMAAVSTRDKLLTNLLLENGANPNLQDGQGEMNAFALAIILNEVTIIKQFLSYGARVNEPCCQNMTPLQLSMNKSVEVSKLLLQNGATMHQVLDIHTGNIIHLAQPPLIQAVVGNNLYLASILLEHGEDINQGYDMCHSSGCIQQSPIHIAVMNGRKEMVALLIQHGANLEKVNGHGETPLGLALHAGKNSNGEIAKMLLHAGCSIVKESKTNFSQKSYSPLHISAFLGFDYHKEIIEWIFGQELDQGNGETLNVTEKSVPKVDECKEFSNNSNVYDNRNNGQRKTTFVNLKATDSSTPLFMAVMSGRMDIVKYIYEKGGDPYVECSQGNLIHAAVMSLMSNEVFDFVFNFDLNIDHINDDGNTPLIIAARSDNSSICQTLISHGAYLNFQDERFGETALSASVYFGRENNAQALLSHGADPDIPDFRKTTALYWSIFNCREKTLRLLLEAGVKLTQRDLANYPRNIRVMQNPELRKMLNDYVSEPPSLQQACRTKVRTHLKHLSQGKTIAPFILQLEIPSKLKKFLLLE